MYPIRFEKHINFTASGETKTTYKAITETPKGRFIAFGRSQEDARDELMKWMDEKFDFGSMPAPDTEQRRGLLRGLRSALGIMLLFATALALLAYMAWILDNLQN